MTRTRIIAGQSLTDIARAGGQGQSQTADLPLFREKGVLADRASDPKLSIAVMLSLVDQMRTKRHSISRSAQLAPLCTYRLRSRERQVRILVGAGGTGDPPGGAGGEASSDIGITRL